MVAMTQQEIAHIKLTASLVTGCYDFERLNPQGTKMLRTAERLFTRQLIMYYLRTHCKLPLRQIGDCFALPVDHATVIHAVTVIQNYIETDKTVRDIVNELIETLVPEQDCISQIESYFLI